MFTFLSIFANLAAVFAISAGKGAGNYAAFALLLGLGLVGLAGAARSRRRDNRS
jgi:hypothetical protein